MFRAAHTVLGGAATAAGRPARRWMRATPPALERILASDPIEDVCKEILEDAG